MDLHDKTSNGNILTNVNSVVASSDLPFGGNSNSQNIASAKFTASSLMSLNTSTSPTNLNLGSSFTIQAWVYITSTASIYTIVAKWGAAGHRSYELQVNRNIGGKFSFLPSYDGTNVGSSAGDNTSAISINGWHHISLTYDNITYRWYLDGIADGTTVATNGSLFASDALLSIGSENNSAIYIDGKIDDVRIWNVARSAGSIAVDYKQQLLGTEANLMGYWPLNALGVSGGLMGGI